MDKDLVILLPSLRQVLKTTRIDYGEIFCPLTTERVQTINKVRFLLQYKLRLSEMALTVILQFEGHSFTI